MKSFYSFVILIVTTLTLNFNAFGMQNSENAIENKESKREEEYIIEIDLDTVKKKYNEQKAILTKYNLQIEQNAQSIDLSNAHTYEQEIRSEDAQCDIFLSPISSDEIADLLVTQYHVSFCGDVKEIYLRVYQKLTHLNLGHLKITEDAMKKILKAYPNLSIQACLSCK